MNRELNYTVGDECKLLKEPNKNHVCYEAERVSVTISMTSVASHSFFSQGAGGFTLKNRNQFR